MDIQVIQCEAGYAYTHRNKQKNTHAGPELIIRIMPIVGLISLILLRSSILLVEVATFLILRIVNHCQVARTESNAVLTLIINGRFEF